MSENKGGAPGASESEVGGVFKSADIAPQRMNSMTNSAVSDVAVERGSVDMMIDRVIEEVVTPSFDGFVETPAETTLTAAEESRSAAAAAAQSLQEIQASMAKVNEVVQSVEERQSRIEEAHQKAEAMLAEVNRISEALSFDNALRERIQATIARTRRLRNGLEK